MKFEEIKFTIAKIQFENLRLNTDKTAIEANPSTHKIAEWVHNNFVPLGAEVIMKTAEENKKLKEALAKAMFNKRWVTEKCTNYDPGAGSDYEIDFTDEMKEWAKLCDVDIDKKDPTWYWRK